MLRGAPKLSGGAITDARVVEEDIRAMVDMIVQYLDDRSRLLDRLNRSKKERDRIRAALKSGENDRLRNRLSDIERDLSIMQSMLSSLSFGIVGMWSYVRRHIEGAEGKQLPPRLRHIKAAIEQYREVLQAVQTETAADLRREAVKARGRKDRWDPKWLEAVAAQTSVEDEALERLEGTPEGTVEPDRLVMDLELTERQAEIAQLYSQGYSYTQIAEQLGITKGSVSVHLQKIRKKKKEASDGVQLKFWFEDCV